jgi:hypothetical protein
MANNRITRGIRLEQEGSELERIHRKANRRKAVAYWLGFLKGVLASHRIEDREVAPMRIEAERFLSILDDADAAELIEDLDIWADQLSEVYLIIECIIDVRSEEFVPETTKDEINEFYGFCAGIACDNVITPTEVESLLHRLASSPHLLTDPRMQSLEFAARRSIADGVITPDESEDICEWITRFVGDSASDTGIATFGNVGLIDGAIEDAARLVIESRMFVLTGKFTIAPRKVVAGMISERGGNWKNNVCSKTDYLVVAAEASRDWKHSHEGTKIIRALELREQGGRPELVHEGTLVKALDLGI